MDRCKNCRTFKLIFEVFIQCHLVNFFHPLHASVQSLLELMVDAAESLCPHVMKRANLRTELIQASSSKMVVPKSFVTKTLLEQSGVDIVNKIR